jgi:octaprenyl-diphosphate synthase
MVLDWLPKETVHAIETLNLSLSVHSVPEIDGLLSKTVLFRGKKFRPTLCFLMGQLLGRPMEELEPYARAAEFVHAATLAHDDVIDDSLMRRSRPTLNARTTNGRAVLAGDLLLARVMAELSSLGQIEIIADLAKTVEDLVTGEWLQLEARGIVPVNRLHLETVARKKTASLMGWCCATPMRLSKLNQAGLKQNELVDSARHFGESLGTAFQMIDDVIDYDGSGQKPFAQDLREGLVNFVTLEMIEQNEALIHPIQMILGRMTPEAGGVSAASANWPWKPYELNSACDRVRVRAQAKLEVADHHLNQISKSLDAPNYESLQALRSILVYLKERIR